MNKTIIQCLGFISALSFIESGICAEIFDTIPAEIDAQKSYVFYSHGYIVEGDNPTPVDERFGWGLYDFPKIKEALSDKDYTLIATHRPKNTDAYKYATQLSLQVRELVDHGVNPENITIVGFSRGAFITGLTSDKLSDLGVNTVILAGCGPLISKHHMDIKVHGHVLSIYEKSDQANTCEELRKKSNAIKSFKEIEINTGLQHGAFYRPVKEWVLPVKNWIKLRRSSD